jgi:hypothetical protein
MIFCFAADRDGFPPERYQYAFVRENFRGRELARSAGFQVVGKIDRG